MPSKWTDERIDAYIAQRLKDEDIEWGHFISGRVYMDRLLTPVGKYDQFRPYDNLEIPVRDLVRYWWNRHADREWLIDTVLDCIETDFKDRARPSQPEPEPMADFQDAFDEVFDKAV